MRGILNGIDVDEWWVYLLDTLINRHCSGANLASLWRHSLTHFCMQTPYDKPPDATNRIEPIQPICNRTNQNRNPSTDARLAANFNAQFPEGKALCKKYLQRVRGEGRGG